MTKAQIKEIGHYLENLEISLKNADYSTTSLQAELSKIYETIKLLMDETSQTEDKEEKLLLAYMEMRFRDIRDMVESRLGVRN